MRSKLLKASIIFALLAILLGMPLLFTPHRIRAQYLSLLQPGMTESQVEEMLGAKAGNYDGYDVQPINANCVGAVTQKSWCGRYGFATVWFDADGRVLNYQWAASAPRTWWASLWHRLLPPPPFIDPNW